MSLSAVRGVAAAAFQWSSTQSLPLEGLSVSEPHSAGSPADVSLYCWDWPAEDLERWAGQHAPTFETWEGRNFTGRRGRVTVAGVSLQVSVIVSKPEQD